jgi:hypothetical protein
MFFLSFPEHFLGLIKVANGAVELVKIWDVMEGFQEMFGWFPFLELFRLEMNWFKSLVWVLQVSAKNEDSFALLWCRFSIMFEGVRRHLKSFDLADEFVCMLAEVNLFIYRRAIGGFWCEYSFLPKFVMIDDDKIEVDEIRLPLCL